MSFTHKFLLNKQYFYYGKNPYLMSIIDTLYGSAADDIIFGSNRNDIVFAGNGNDTIYSSIGSDTLNGGAGSDLVTYENSDVGVFVNLLTGVGKGGFAEGDKLISIERIVGSSLNDTLHGNADNNFIGGGAGIDYLEGGAGNDTLHGNADQDGLYGGIGNDLLVGGAGTDTMFGGDGNDTIYASKDTTNSYELLDVINGGAGTDVVSFHESNYGVRVSMEYSATAARTGTFNIKDIEQVVGSKHNDLIEGSSKNDFIHGDVGDDTLFGGAGNDVISGGLGVDVLKGGEGTDVFLYDTTFGNDVILDFNTNDVIYISKAYAANFADLLTHTYKVEGHTMLNFGSQNILLNNVNISSLEANDFVFI